MEINAKQRLKAAPENPNDPYSLRYLQRTGFMSAQQAQAMLQGMRGEEGQYFKDKCSEITKLVVDMPKTYEQDGKGDKAIAYLHYFKGGGDWYITERDMGPRQDQAFGLASLQGNDPELGYISLVELAKHNVELDLHFKPTTIGELKKKHRR